jgi:hypothetical protein
LKEENGLLFPALKGDSVLLPVSKEGLPVLKGGLPVSKEGLPVSKEEIVFYFRLSKKTCLTSGLECLTSGVEER